jgi:carboxypeptidase C (cathepsin A)
MRYLLLFLLAFGLYAKESRNEKEDYEMSRLTITNHKIDLLSGPLEYTAMTGMCPVYKMNEKLADLFFISYTKESEENRPITFVFPGGPGGAGTHASILDLGPRRLMTASEGRTILPPYKIIDNQETLLEYTDLVFVDPPGCGFSEFDEDVNPLYFYSVDTDIQTLSEFIQHYLDLEERWNSPVYLSGSSYGTLRCCGLSHYLLGSSIAVHGIILTGCAFEWSTLFTGRDKALPDAFLIPTFAATAWYHKRLWPEKSLQEVTDYARDFVYNEYAPQMLKPTRLNSHERALFEERLAELIGLPVQTVRRYSGRINEDIYTKEFFNPERKVLGALDTRYSSEIATIDPAHSFDPSYLDNHGLDRAFHFYLQKELNTRLPSKKYVSFSNKILQNWNEKTYDSLSEVSLLQRLRSALIINPLMKVFIGSGYYDCRTPFAATEYCFEHLELPASFKDNLQFFYYEAGHGHMFDYPSLKKWKTDLLHFYGY